MTLEKQIFAMQQAYKMADWSRDPSSQNGAVIVPPDFNLHNKSLGFNRFYQGVPENFENRDRKLEGIEHAERDAIYQAAKNGFQTNGAILVCPWVACRECSRGIIGSGISKVICHNPRMSLTDPRWKSNVNEALGWMVDAGIDIVYLHDPIPGAPNIRVSGLMWSPSRCCYV